MAYDYYEAVKDSVKDLIDSGDFDTSTYEDEDKLIEDLYDACWADDSVTGNGSGSYTFNRAQAAEYVADNLELLGEALEAFGYNGVDILYQGAESCDVTIRCYVLGEVVDEVVKEVMSK